SPWHDRGPMTLARRHLLLALAAFGCNARAATAASLPRALPVPGGVARVALGAAPTVPVATQDDVPLLVTGTPAGWTALVGIPLAAKPGKAQIHVRAGEGDERTIEFTIRAKNYLVQRLQEIVLC